MARVAQVRQLEEASKLFQRGKRFRPPTPGTESLAFLPSTLPSFLVLQNCDGNPLKDSVTRMDLQ